MNQLSSPTSGNESTRKSETATEHPVLVWSDERLSLGVGVMDGYHKEFVTILGAAANVPGSVFLGLFRDLVRHTREHFANEETLMRETRFAAMDEHVHEHRRILGDLDALLKRAERGRIAMAREFVRNQMPDWFQLHLVTMDSALAKHLKDNFNLE